MNYGLVRSYFHQLKPLDAIKYLGLQVVQSVLDPWASISYAQTGEDRIIATLLDGRSIGFYVDVGCNHPVRYSNTFALYKRGWHGINVDANERLIERCRRVRPRDVSICAVVSSAAQEVIFTEFDDDVVSSVSPAHVAKWQMQKRVVGERRVHARTLNEILVAAAAPPRFDLLSIDVEGHDFDVLSSLDLDAYRARLIVIEMHDFPLRTPEQSQIWSHLVANGYDMVGYAVMNGYFVDTRA